MFIFVAGWETCREWAWGRQVQQGKSQRMWGRNPRWWQYFDFAMCQAMADRHRADRACGLAPGWA
jgi:hypothetical protein